MSYEYNYTQNRPLVGKSIKAVDFTETRTNGNTQRTNRGLSPVSWSAGTPTTGQKIKGAHMRDIRSLGTGLVNYGGSNFAFTDTIIDNITRIRARHMEEVRQVVDDSANAARCFTCSSACSIGCTSNCRSNCQTSCSTACAGSCANACGGTCSSGCNNVCTGACSGTCASGCSGYCSGACGGSCGSNCTGICALSCSNRCVGGCSNSCRRILCGLLSG